jgi:ribonuclease Z
MAAMGADLLIHEATFEDGMEAEAALKRHSTVGEALDVARRMDARCTILTHFSQRYPKIQPLPLDKSYLFPIVFAFDYMRLKPSTLMTASKLTPALRLLYPDIDVIEENNEPTIAQVALSIPGLFAHSELL